jgi:hypothetical protein
MKIKFVNQNFNSIRWIGIRINKTILGLGYSFGSPVWLFPFFEFVLGDKRYSNEGIKKHISLCFGWLFVCLCIQIVGVKYE